jgi:hypothetical protein
VWLDADTDNAAAHLAVLWAGIADAIQLEGLAKKHNVTDPSSLLTKLSNANYGDIVALVDFVERFWADDEEAKAVLRPPGGEA